jgi:acyl-CoA synthetase (AMP-forming)/AMP-acid ligase II
VFTDYLDRGLSISPDAVCVMRGDGSGAMTYRELYGLSHRVAAGLRDREGLGPGGKVAVFAPNGPVTLALVLGIIRSGAAWVALNPRGEAAELAQLLELVDCDLLIWSSAFADRVPEVLARAPSLKAAVRFPEHGTDSGFEGWLGPEGSSFPRLPFQPEAPAMFMGSGGTTGAPKGIVITGRQLTAMSLAFNSQLREPAPPVYLMATPMTHAAGAVAFPTLGEGGTIIAHDGVDATAIFDSIERYQVTRLFLPPTAVYTLLAAPGARQRDFGSLRHLVYAAAPMSTEKLVEAMEVFGPVMAQTFGQSEAPMICTYLSPAEHAEALADPALRRRLASCGRPSAVAAVEVMDDDGNLLPRGERGEIVVRGDLVMREYYRNEAATAEVRRPGGWHATGDVGYIDEAGYVYIVDRKRDLIISGGFNVFPSDVEQVLWSHPAVLDCAVIGLPHEKWGEAVTAVVELKPGTAAAEGELIALCKQRLGSIRAPKAVLFRELPRSNAGKVLKRALRDEYWAGTERKV